MAHRRLDPRVRGRGRPIAPGPRGPARARLLGPLVFVVGAASLGAEIAAVRLLAPYFGTSTIVWANTIATVLIALSAGYWIGGRMADRWPSAPILCGTVLVAAVGIALVPFAAGPFLNLSLSAFEDLSAGAFTGSLFGVLLLVALPLVLLGTVSPWALRLAVGRVEEAGEIAGRLYAIGTFGSLVGVFLSALLLVPVLGTQRTFVLYALALAVVAVAGLRPRMRVAPALLAALLLLPAGTTKADTDAGARVLAERETEYQYARVIEEEGGRRLLELNEGQAVHSQISPGTFLTGDYWDEMLALPLAAGEGVPERIAILGNAGGTTARAYGEFFPATEIDGVEIDGELSELGREYFDMRAPKLTVYTEDARTFLRRADDETYDSIFVDAYRQPYIPFHLTTREFFALAADKLRPGGTLIVNVGHPEGSDELERVMTATMEAEFGNVVRDAVEDTNVMLVAGDAELSAGAIRAAAPGLPGELRPLAAEVAARVEEPLEGTDVWTDDKAPVEFLIDSSLVEYATDGG